MNAEVRSTTGKVTKVEFPLRTLPAAEKRRAAFKALGLCWLAMIVTAPLPPIHWVSVPGCFVAGLYLFFRRLRENSHVEPFSFACPECGKTVDVAERSYDPEWEQVCPQCHFSLQVVTPEAEGAPA